MKTGPARVVTTNSLDRWIITDYKGLVSSHIVAGTGLFSDFAASFTDIFGGRSGTYRKQLRSLQSEVTRELAEEAARLGANWVVGTHIDFDEISGKGMQMIMVSGQGTAVSATPIPSAETSAHGERVEGAVTADELAAAVARESLVNTARSEKLNFFSATTWESLAEHKVEDALIPAIKHVVSSVNVADSESTRKHFMDYFHSLPGSAVQPALHGCLVSEPDCRAFAYSLIKTESLADLTWVLNHIADSDFIIRHAALQLIAAHSPSYGPSSIEVMQSIVAHIPNAFPETATLVDKKGMFRKEGEKQWRCGMCSEEVLNEVQMIHCRRCNRDRRGFEPQDLTPEKALAELNARSQCLQAALGLAL